MMAGKTARNVYSANNNKEHYMKLNLVGYMKYTSSNARLHEH